MSISIGAKPSSGSSSYTSFTLANNQSSPANVTGFSVSNPTQRGFSAECSITRIHTPSYATPTADPIFNQNLQDGVNYGGGASVVNSVTKGLNNDTIIGGDFTSIHSFAAPGVAKLSASGVVDSSFQTNLGTGADSSVYAVAVQSDGKVLVGGVFTTFNGSGIPGIVRLNADGSLDSAFNTNLGTGLVGGNDIRAIAIQADNKIVLGGSFTSFNGNTRNYLIRLNSDGTEDTTFYTNYDTAGGANQAVFGLAYQSDGSIVVVGSFTQLNGVSRNRVFRVTSTGSVDSSFNTNTGTAAGSNINSVALLSSGAIILGGAFTTFNGSTVNRLMALNSDGTAFTSYNTNIGTAFNGIVYSVAAQGDDKIVAGGLFGQLNGSNTHRLARINADGSRDSTFDNIIGNNGYDGTVLSVAIGSNNKIEVGTAAEARTWLGVTNAIPLGIFQLDADSGERVAEVTFKGIYRPSASAWEIGGETSMGDDTGVSFSITAGGQLQYTSTDIPNTLITSEMRFRITGL